jgi:hypothetical protein
MIGTGPLGLTLGAASTTAVALGKRLFWDGVDLVSIKRKVPLLVLPDFSPQVAIVAFGVAQSNMEANIAC